MKKIIGPKENAENKGGWKKIKKWKSESGFVSAGKSIGKHISDIDTIEEESKEG